ncbi:hypothetical protein HDV00_011612 [Rhizophlyctis rosea]|nr:hypothetical protein HDV00_011612 [Rhizophlyctis rosea]
MAALASSSKVEQWNPVTVEALFKAIRAMLDFSKSTNTDLPKENITSLSSAVLKSAHDKSNHVRVAALQLTAVHAAFDLDVLLGDSKNMPTLQTIAALISMYTARVDLPARDGTDTDAELGRSSLNGRLQPLKYEDDITHLVRRIRVPSFFAKDLTTGEDQNLLSQVDAFRQTLLQVTRLLDVMLRCCVADGTVLRGDDDVVFDLLVFCASVLGDDQLRWTTNETRCAAKDLLKLLITACKSVKSTQQLVTMNIKRVLGDVVRPYFQHPHVEYKQHRERKAVKDGGGKEVDFQDQAWKVDRVECVEVLVWFVGEVKHPDFSPIQHLIFPPLLTLLDDWEPQYKQRGVQLLRHVVIENSAPADIRRTGLGDLFFESISRTLTYHTHPPLLRLALLTIIDLVPVIEVRESEAYYARMERILEDYVLRQLSLAMGDKVEVLRILLKGVGRVMGCLGIVGVKYLKPTLGSACDILEMHQGDVETQGVAAETVVAVIRTCWPRVPVYRGVVLKAVAEVWRGLRVKEGRFGGEVDEGKERELERSLRTIVDLLRKCCGDELTPDLQLLLAIDESVFVDLIKVDA